ncbi:MAG: hypothetical protein C5B59_19085 [Bacteroidetes bacterium]|nr:MAG: hypothetical protein C5B59_19085 [Bacteroidota bacterium]
MARFAYVGFDMMYCHYRGVYLWHGFAGTTFLLFLSEPIFTYIVVYSLWPKYLGRKNYKSFFALLTLLILVTYLVDWLLSLDNYADRSTGSLLVSLWNHSRNFFVDGPLVMCGFFVTVRMLKIWYRKLDEKAMLSKETAEAELQLLKAQVHPHFLFNTLNNIYSFTLSYPPRAAKLIQSLSDTLHYMIIECEPALVDVDKELKMIRDYIKLEKIRYGERLHLNLKIEKESGNKGIAPLLMIPFVENSFKHGTSQMLQDSWIIMDIYVGKENLTFKIKNSKPNQPVSKDHKNGIGLMNVQKRLELLYPDRHVLNIEATEEAFSVYMKVPLEKMDDNDEEELSKDRTVPEMLSYVEH